MLSISTVDPDRNVLDERASTSASEVLGETGAVGSRVAVSPDGALTLRERAKMYGFDSADCATFVWEELQRELGRNPTNDEIRRFVERIGYGSTDDAFDVAIAQLVEERYVAIPAVEPYKRFTEAELSALLRALSWRECAMPREWQCGHGQLHQRRDKPNRYRCLFVFCHKWKCARCASWLKNRWASHAAAKMRTTAQIYVAACSQEVWDKQYRSAEQRKRGTDGGYIRVNLAGVPNVPEVVVFTTAPIGEAMETEAAVEMANKMIGLTPSQQRAVSSSRNWQLPNREVTGKWKLVGRVATEMSKAKSIVSEFSLAPSVGFSVGEETAAFEFTVGEDMAEGSELLDVLVRSLGTGVEPHSVTARKRSVRA